VTFGYASEFASDIGDGFADDRTVKVKVDNKSRFNKKFVKPDSNTKVKPKESEESGEKVEKVDMQ